MRYLPVLLLLCLAALPATAFDGGLGVQVFSINNKLAGNLPGEGSWESRRGFGANLLAEINFARDISLSFQPGLTPRDSRQVFKDKGEEVGYIDYDLSYFTFPLLVRITGAPAGVRGFVTAGIEVSILLDATVDYGEGGVDSKDEFNDSSLGALFGAGAMVPLGGNFLVFEFRYTQGLNDIVNRDHPDPEETSESPSIKYRGTSLMAGFLLRLGGGE